MQVRRSFLDNLIGSSRADHSEHRAKLEEQNLLAIIRVAAAAKTDYRARDLVGTVQGALATAAGASRFRILVRAGSAVDRVTTAAVPWKFPAQLTLSEVAALAGVRLNQADIAGLPMTVARDRRADPSIPSDGIVLGDSTVSRGPSREGRKVAVRPEDAMMHVLTLGKNGVGKGSVYLNAASQVIRTPWVDPAGRERQQG